MLEIKGAYITSGLPEENLKLQHELLDFDGNPMLLHLIDSTGYDWLAYWVDFDDNANRWIYSKIQKEELYYYLVGSKSLRDLFKEISSDYVFIRDYNSDEICIATWMINSYSIPEKYYAGPNSYYQDGINEYYQIYLKDNYYLDRLRHESYKIIAEPINKTHGSTVSAKDAAIVLQAASKSMEGFIDVTGFKMLVEKPITKTKLNKKLNQYKRDLTPRIAHNLFHSFEVWLTMDVISMPSENDDETQWRNDLIERYKNDVLNVNISDPEEAKIIAEKYTEEERKIIFEPLMKMYDNDNLSITITDYKKTFCRDLSKNPISQEFKEIIIPKPTKAQIEEEKEKKLKLVQFVAALEEGQDIANIKIRDLKHNLFYGDEQPEADYTIHSPFEYNKVIFHLKKDIKGKFVLFSNGTQKIYHPDLEIEVEGDNFKNTEESYKNQIYSLIQEYLEENDEVKKSNNPIYLELSKYI